MEAKDYIGKYGIDAAKRIVSAAPKWAYGYRLTIQDFHSKENFGDGFYPMVAIPELQKQILKIENGEQKA